MVKLVYVVRARPDVDGEEFHRYWLEEHGANVRSVAAQIGAARYVQSHTLDTPLNGALVESRGMAPFNEGITEVWWHSMEELEAAISTPEGKEAMEMLVEDEATFIDLERSTIFITEEHTIFDFTGDADAADSA
jgi:uncharacterized protein (TIGR02118 family)